MNFNLLLITLIIFSCIFFNKISFRFGIPTLFVFILLGMAFGSDGFARISFDNFALSETVCSVALIFIMFYGGFGTNWKMARPVARQSILLSTAGVFLTALFLGLFLFLLIRRELWLCFLTGSTLASTDAASVFSVLRSRKLDLKENTASILELESGSNDPMAYMLTLVCLSFLTGKADVGSILRLLTAQLVFGIAIGMLCGLLSYRILKSVSFEVDGFDVIFIAGIALFSYALSAALGGNGYLSTYLTGIILGNVKMSGKKNIVHFFDGLTGLMQIAVFFLLGLLATPSLLPSVLVSAVSVFLFLTLIARPLAVKLLLLPFRASKGQSRLISFAGLRGASSIVFAIMAVQTLKSDTRFFHIIFFVVLLSLLLQGSLLPFAAQRFDMIDLSNDVMKTFTDYSEELPVQFIQLTLAEDNEWVGKHISELSLPLQFLFLLIVRGEQKLVPKGSTLLEAGDSLILCAPAIQTRNAMQLSEIEIDKSSEYLHCRIRDIKLPRGEIIFLIQRGNQSIIPNGQTEILAGDVLMLTRLKEKTRPSRRPSRAPA